MADIPASNWNATDASNTTAAPDGAPEGMNPSGVNDTMRAMIGATKRWWNKSNSTATTTGTSTAYVLTYTPASSADYDGEEHAIILHTATGVAPTLAINSRTARNLRRLISGTWTNVTTNDYPTGTPIKVRYNLADTTYDIVRSPPDVGSAAATILTTRGDMIRRGASLPERVALGASGKVMGSDGTDAAWAWAIRGVPQTVQGGPVTSVGLPDFLPATDADLNLVSQNISSTYPLVAVASNGFANGGRVGRVGTSTSNLTWTGLTASRAAATPNFLYVTVNDDGTLTTGFTLVAPIYQWGGTPAVTSGLFTFNISEMRGYLGNGGTAPQTNLVMVGEAATDGTGVISTVAYAYNGRYDSGFTATLTIAGISKNCNIGAEPSLYVARYAIQNTTADENYAVGDVIVNGVNNASTNSGIIPIICTRNTVALSALSNQFTSNKTTGSSAAALTVASWKYKLTAERGW